MNIPLGAWIAAIIVAVVLALGGFLVKPIRNRVAKWFIKKAATVLTWLVAHDTSIVAAITPQLVGTKPSSKEATTEEALAEELITRGCLTLVERTGTDLATVLIRKNYYTNVILYSALFTPDIQAKTADYIAHYLREEESIDIHKWGVSYFSCRRNSPYFDYYGYINGDVIHSLAEKVAERLGIGIESPWNIKKKKVIFISTMVSEAIKDCFDKMYENQVREILAYFILEPAPRSLDDLLVLEQSLIVKPASVIRFDKLKQPNFISLLLGRG
jgi:hypothetical protein